MSRTLLKIHPYSVNNFFTLRAFLKEKGIPESAYVFYGEGHSSKLDNIIFFNKNDAIIAKLSLPFLIVIKNIEDDTV